MTTSLFNRTFIEQNKRRSPVVEKIKRIVPARSNERAKLHDMAKNQVLDRWKFIPEAVKSSWEGKTDDQIFQSIAYSFACLFTSPTAYEPTDCPYDVSDGAKKRFRAWQRSKKRNAVKRQKTNLSSE